MASLAQLPDPSHESPARAAAVATLQVHSEVGPLRRVIVHRPGRELHRLTPATCAELLFDDVVWAERAAEEHDAITVALREHGVEVLYVRDLLAETVALEAARAELIDATLSRVPCGPRLERALRRWLEGLEADELTGCLIGGILFEELPFPSHSLTALMSEAGAFAIPPLPNHMFTRDASAWAYGGVSIHTMARPARARESLHMALIYSHHPLFAETGYRMWTDAAGESLGIEGGDVLVIGNGAVLVGTGERTSPAAVEQYAGALFEAGAARRVIVTALPGRRATIHLDTVMTMVDRDAFAVYQGLPGTLDAYVLSPARGGLAVTHAPDLFEVVREALELSRLRLIRGDWDDGTAQREQWGEGSNLLAIRPGVVIAYDRNAETNARLCDNGVEVIAVPGSELSRGRGGPRCLTCPIERAPIE